MAMAMIVEYMFKFGKYLPQPYRCTFTVVHCKENYPYNLSNEI